MRKLKGIPMIVIFYLALMVIATATKAEEINFEAGSWNEIKSMAAEQERIIFIDAYATWCGPCKAMTKNVFTDNEVAAFYNDNFVNYKIDMETSEGAAFGEEYEVTAYPTLFYIQPDGSVVKKVVGYHDVDQMLKMANDILHPEESDLHKLGIAYINGQRDTAFLYDYLLELYDNGLEEEKIVKEYFDQMDTINLLDTKPFIIFYLMIEDIYTPQSQFFMENYLMFETYFGDYANEKLFYVIDANVTIARENQDEERVQQVIEYLKMIVEGPQLVSIENEIWAIYHEE